METVIVGNAERCTVSFAVGTTATDPTVVSSMIRTPLGVETTQLFSATNTSSTIVRQSTGMYYLDLTYDQEGPWVRRWKAQGTVIAATETTVNAVSAFDNP